MTPLAPPSTEPMPAQEHAPVVDRLVHVVAGADESARLRFVDQDARILAAAFDCLHLLAQAEIQLAFGRLAPFRVPEGR